MSARSKGQSEQLNPSPGERKGYGTFSLITPLLVRTKRTEMVIASHLSRPENTFSAGLCRGPHWRSLPCDWI